MDDNVFAPGSTGSAGNPGVHSDPYEWTDRSFNDVLGLLGRAWNLLIGNIGTIGIGIAIIFGLSILNQVLSFAIGFGAETVDDEMTKAMVNLGAQIPNLFFAFIQLYFQMGLVKLAIELDRGNEPELDALWSQGSAFIQMLVVSMVLGIAYVVAMAVVGGVVGGVGFGAVTALGFETGIWIAVGIGGLVLVALVIAVVVIGLGLQLIMQALVDGRASFLEVIPFSWNLTDGWKVFLFLQGIVNFVVAIVAMCVTLCFASPVVSGLFLVLGGVTYNAILHDADVTGRLAS